MTDPQQLRADMKALIDEAYITGSRDALLSAIEALEGIGYCRAASLVRSFLSKITEADALS